MDMINGGILLGSALLLVSILTSLVSFRFGAPLLLLFLGLGLGIGPDGLALIHAVPPAITFGIGSIALAVVLFESGFDTPLRTVRMAAGPALALSSVGTLLTAFLIGAGGHYVLQMPWPDALLMGAVLSSTDAAAVFFLLRVGGITLRDRVRSTLEIESSSNDPIAILLTISMVEFIANGGGEFHWSMVALFFSELAIGVLMGWGGGVLMVRLINRIRLVEGLYPLLSLGLALFIYAATNAIHGSGFLAIYVAGLVAGNSKIKGAQNLRHFHNGLTWLSQIVMFVMLGLLATPADFPSLLFPACFLAILLIFVARPLAVFLSLLPFRFSFKESTFIGWVGLRGAVSILLALVPVMEGMTGAQTIFNVVFLVVIVSLLIQGWTVKPLAERLGLVVPPLMGPVERLDLALPVEGDYDLVTYRILPHSPVATGVRLPRWARPSLIIRGGRVWTIHKLRGLQAGDLVLLFAARHRLPLLDRLYSGAKPIGENDHEFFGDMVLHADTTVQELGTMYGIPVSPDNAELTLAQLFENEFKLGYELGDRMKLGPVDLIVRNFDADGIQEVGLALSPASAKPLLPVFVRRLLHRA